MIVRGLVERTVHQLASLVDRQSVIGRVSNDVRPPKIPRFVRRRDAQLGRELGERDQALVSRPLLQHFRVIARHVFARARRERNPGLSGARACRERRERGRHPKAKEAQLSHARRADSNAVWLRRKTCSHRSSSLGRSRGSCSFACRSGWSARSKMVHVTPSQSRAAAFRPSMHGARVMARSADLAAFRYAVRRSKDALAVKQRAGRDSRDLMPRFHRPVGRTQQYVTDRLYFVQFVLLTYRRTPALACTSWRPAGCVGRRPCAGG